VRRRLCGVDEFHARYDVAAPSAMRSTHRRAAERGHNFRHHPVRRPAAVSKPARGSRHGRAGDAVSVQMVSGMRQLSAVAGSADGILRPTHKDGNLTHVERHRAADDAAVSVNESRTDLAAARRAAVSTSPADKIPAPPMNLRREWSLFIGWPYPIRLVNCCISK
jgi:hypothetical protein